jgi:isopenicillin N synthase-like dioxygenase
VRLALRKAGHGGSNGLGNDDSGSAEPATIALSLAEASDLVLLEAANLLDQGDAYLLDVQARAPCGLLGRAIGRLRDAAKLARVPLPPIIVYNGFGAAVPRAGALARLLAAAARSWRQRGRLWCCSAGGGGVTGAGAGAAAAAERPPPPHAAPPDLLLDPAAAALPEGCFFVDAEAGGPLCPPHLAPALLLPPSRLHAALPPQSVTPLPAHPGTVASVDSLERGEAAATPPSERGRAIGAAELRAAAANPSCARSRALAAEVAALLAAEGFLRIDFEAVVAACSSSAESVVSRAFAAAANFFDLGAEHKRPVTWRTGAARKFTGFRAEGPREFFAVRSDCGRDPCAAAAGDVPVEASVGADAPSAATGAGAAPHSGQWPATAWAELFFLQRAVARDLLVLLLLHSSAGVRGLAGAAAGALAGEDDPSVGTAAITAAMPLLDNAESCSDVMRVYRYRRPAGCAAPGLRAAATSSHADVGLLTVAPLSTRAGLVLLRPDGARWTDVEVEERPSLGTQRFVTFLGEAGARLLAARSGGSAAAAALRAPVHFVEERGERFSAPFFLRAPAAAELAPGLTNERFLRSLALRPWARLRRDMDPVSFASDF